MYCSRQGTWTCRELPPFRLPPALEDRLENCIDEIDWTESGKQIDSRESAMAALKRLADAVVKAPSGPVQVGLERRIMTPTAIHRDGGTLLPFCFSRRDSLFSLFCTGEKCTLRRSTHRGLGRALG